MLKQWALASMWLLHDAAPVGLTACKVRMPLLDPRTTNWSCSISEP